MKWAVTARRCFDERLRGLGFVLVIADGMLLAWVKRINDQRDLMVEIEKERGFRCLHVYLRRRGSVDEVFDLAEAAGLRGYEYHTQRDLEHAMEQARGHFEAWGSSWLDGSSIDTPALAASRQAHQQYTHERLIREGRTAFKQKAYEEAIARFAEASRMAALDDVTEKMLALALKRRGA